MATAPVLRHLRREVLPEVELDLIGRNRPGNFSIARSCGSDRSLDSYHMTVPQLRQCGSGPVDRLTRRTPYSIQKPRDRSVIGTELEQYACGLDIAFPPRHLRALSKALIALVQTNPPYARDVREIIYTPDGTTVLRWDAERGMASAPRAGEADRSHLWHTHISQRRDAVLRMGTAELVIRALARAQLITAQRMQQYLAALGVADPTAPDEEDEVNKDDVKLVQQRLNEATGAGLVVDGDFGALTRAAVDALPTRVAEREQAAVAEATDATRTDVKDEAAEAAAAAIKAL